jgi:hypothetical protein
MGCVYIGLLSLMARFACRTCSVAALLQLLQLCCSSEHDDNAFWRSVTDNPVPGLTDADSFETIVHNLAPYVDYRHAIASEGQSAGSSTSERVFVLKQ